MAVQRKPQDLRQACIREAMDIITEHGIENLSLRDVARRLKVSHQAPYKHFASREHILSEVLAQCFLEFALYLEKRPKLENPQHDLRGLGERYMQYAKRFPLKYKLLFNTPLPDSKSHPGMMQNAQKAFSLLRNRLELMPLRALKSREANATLDALFVWSTLHGLAGILQSDTLTTLQLKPSERKEALDYCFARLGAALEA